jgi:hypothetical protein
VISAFRPRHAGLPPALGLLALALTQIAPALAVAQPAPAPDAAQPPLVEPAAPAPAAVPEPVLAPAAELPPPVVPELAPAPQPAPALPSAPPPPVVPEKKADTPWYDKLKIRGYAQFRYNRIPTFNDNDKLVNAQGDRTIGVGNGFSIRRARVILFGDVHDRVSVYIQPDFASTIDTQLHVAILRDFYADLFLDAKKQFRFRVGQSKVPYGFENLQSSQNRLPLDRNDALNSAVKDERDIGIFFYYAPEEIRARFKHLVDSGLKGSGDYGVLGLGVYNGQTANRPALSDDLHMIGRLTWPFKFGEQFVEVGGGGYYGKFYTEVDTDKGYMLPRGKIKDARAHATVVVYPQPFGFQAEGTFGSGPSAGDSGDADELLVKNRKLFGGYAQVMYKIDGVAKTLSLIPYARGTYYDGGKKFEKNAPHYIVKELELGLEWQFIKNLELVLAYDLSERTSSKSYDTEKGHVARVQVQVNY